MPYEWIEPPALSGSARLACPIAELHCWPYRSLPRRDFVLFIGATATLISLPLLVLIGSAALWGLLPFFMIALGSVWYAIERSYRDGSVLEELRLWPEQVTLDRHNPRGPDQSWQANPFWVEVALHRRGGPVENYVTLRGGGREVEIGAFLTPEERSALYADLTACLARTRAPR